MKKVMTIIFVVLISAVLFFSAFTNERHIPPNLLYRVYLDDLVLGVISSRTELEEYIDLRGEEIKNKYGVDSVFAPSGLNIREFSTYRSNIDDVSTVYERIQGLRDFTIEGYQFTLRLGEDTQTIFVTEEEIFRNSLENAIVTFLGRETWEEYLEERQPDLRGTGTTIENVYISEAITRRKVRIPTDEIIYTDVSELSKFILFGTTEEQKTYIVRAGDTIESVSERNKINTQEFLIANPTFTSVDNLLAPGQEVNVIPAEPVVNVVIESTLVRDQRTFYRTEERYSSSLNIGAIQVVQEGRAGTSRVTSDVRSVNGNIVHANTTRVEERVAPTNRIVLFGTRHQHHVGGGSWTWPVGPGWGISSHFGWRSFGGWREFHQGVDIWIRHGSPVFAANNGTVVSAGWLGTFGLRIVINHNNGYHTLYAHLSGLAPGIRVGSVVGAGQLIGYVGSTGNASGPHLHYEVWYRGTPINPMNMHR